MKVSRINEKLIFQMKQARYFGTPRVEVISRLQSKVTIWEQTAEVYQRTADRESRGGHKTAARRYGQMAAHARRDLEAFKVAVIEIQNEVIR